MLKNARQGVTEDRIMKRRKWIALSAALLLLLLSAVNIYGADEAANAAADTLYELGLFAGTGTDADGKPVYSLEKPLNRQEAMVMFLNLLGEAGEALEGSHEMPFTDVDEWAKPFIAYAYEKGYTAGVAADRFGAHDPVTRDQYHTYLLLALGYEQGTDFAWNSSAVFARENAGFNEVFVDGPVLRGHAVRWNANAIAVPKKGEETCMAGAFEGKPADAVFIPARQTAAAEHPPCRTDDLYPPGYRLLRSHHPDLREGQPDLFLLPAVRRRHDPGDQRGWNGERDAPC